MHQTSTVNGIVEDGNFIREVTTTLVLPEFQDGRGQLYVYLGMMTTTGDYVQACAGSDRTLNVAHEYLHKWNCDVFVNPGPKRGKSREVPGGPAVPGDLMTSHYVYDDSTGAYTQTNSVNGVVLATLTKASGYGHSLQFNSECLTFKFGKPTCGTVPARKWINTTVILDKADPDFGDFGSDPGVSGKFVSSQGGKVWTMAELDMEASSSYMY
ncbi:hypothetical protein Tdes44962_MAKER07643 [Teratosphaeria destructans]|uniref:Uncharacterized protein n=1 Tax=Teratosphaeria destructans TaxID=418781 RepID=A0A9W7SYT2_9PEZI|nr:hypothetical protein Tdes44962_MAKER07643 [Teratosphaeria destructans]